MQSDTVFKMANEYVKDKLTGEKHLVLKHKPVKLVNPVKKKKKLPMTS